jgi:hypothetical protein
MVSRMDQNKAERDRLEAEYLRKSEQLGALY